jgi:hypothetical protein
MKRRENFLWKGLAHDPLKLSQGTGRRRDLALSLSKGMHAPGRRLILRQARGMRLKIAVTVVSQSDRKPLTC